MIGTRFPLEGENGGTFRERSVVALGRFFDRKESVFSDFFFFFIPNKRNLPATRLGVSVGLG